jgi:hypothetical protein
MGWVAIATLQPLYPWKKIQYPLYRKLDRPQGQSEWVRKIPSPPAFDLQTIQLVFN